MLGKTALITGISGQDGSLLAKNLLSSGYRVVGTSRDHRSHPFDNLGALGIRDSVELLTLPLDDQGAIRACLREFKPGEVYNLACQSSVGLSFQEPDQTRRSIVEPSFAFLDSIARDNLPIRYLNPASGDMFGETAAPANELSPFAPVSPYAKAKLEVFDMVREFRDKHSIFASSAILFNHESPMRDKKFVSQKIVHGALDVRDGLADNIQLGNLGVVRDWGWAPEYVAAFPRILTHNKPDDFILATGKGASLADFVECVFSELELNRRDHILFDDSVKRPHDVAKSVGDPQKANDQLNWRAGTLMSGVAKNLVNEALKHRKN